MPPSPSQQTQRQIASGETLAGVASALWAFGPSQRAALYAQNWAWPNLVVGLPALQALYRNGWIAYDEYRNTAILLGADQQVEGLHGYNYQIRNGVFRLGDRVAGRNTLANFAKQFWDSAWIPSVSQAVELFLRGLIDEDYLRHVYTRNGINVPELQSLMEKSWYQIPSIGELQAFSRRTQFDVGLRSRANLDEGFDDNSEWAVFMRANGVGEVTAIDGAGRERSIDLRRELWSQHWTIPGINEAKQFLYRLRRENVAARHVEGKKTTVFTEQDFDDVLRMDGYNATYRQRIIETAYRLPERRILLQMAKANKLDRDELLDVIRSEGYDERYTGRIADSIWSFRNKKLSIGETRQLIDRNIIPRNEGSDAIASLGYDKGDADRILSIPRKNISEAMISTLITRRMLSVEEGIVRLTWDGYSDEDAKLLANYAWANKTYGDERQAYSSIKEAYRIGVIDRAEMIFRLMSRGDSRLEAELAANIIDLEVKVSHVKTAIAVIKKQYIHAYLLEGPTRVELRRLGITDSGIDRLISEWNLLITPRHRELSAQQTVQSFKRGLISVNTLAARLSALGYASDDISLLQLSALQDVAKSNAASALKASRSVATQQRFAKQQLVAILRQKKQAERDLARHGTPAQLVKWLGQNLITRAAVVTRLRALEWPDDDITRLVESAALAKVAKQPAAKSTTTKKGQGSSSP